MNEYVAGYACRQQQVQNGQYRCARQAQDGSSSGAAKLGLILALNVGKYPEPQPRAPDGCRRKGPMAAGSH